MGGSTVLVFIQLLDKSEIILLLFYRLVLKHLNVKLTHQD